MFGWTIIHKSELEVLKTCAMRNQKLNQVERWFSGWRDLDIIWKYIFEEINYGGIERARKDYAEARGTDEYGKPKERGR